MAGQMCHGALTQCVQRGQRDPGGGSTRRTEGAPGSPDFMITLNDFIFCLAIKN